MPGLDLRQVWSPRVPLDDAALAQLSPGWRLLLFQDGSATRAMGVLSGQSIEVEVLEAVEMDVDFHAPPEIGLLAKPHLAARCC